MSNGGQVYGSQEPGTSNGSQDTGIPDWLLSFIRNQQETNARLEQGIIQLQSTATAIHDNNTQNSSTERKGVFTTQPESVADLGSTLRRPKHSLTHPEKFTGEDEALYPQFKGLMEAKLEIDAQAIGSERERIWYAFGRLTGKAAGRIFPWMNATKNTETFTVEEFFKQLDTAFADPQKQSKALSKINLIRQGNRDFREFLRDFEQTLFEAQGWKWDDSVRKGYLKAAINRELRDRLVTQEEPALYSEYVAQLRRISDNMQEIKAWDFRRNRTSRFSKQTQPPPTNQALVDPMEWEPTRIAAAAARSSPTNRSPQFRQAQRAPSSTPEERKERREAGACVRCGSLDHWVSDCYFMSPVPVKPRSRTTQPTAPVRRPQVAASTAPKTKSLPVMATDTHAEEIEGWETDEESGKE
jgi:hypothetical protein